MESSNDSDKSFFLVWRNLYLRKKILTDCLFFRNHNKEIKFTDYKRLANHRFRNYLTNIRLDNSFSVIKEGFKFPPFLETLSISVNTKEILEPLPNTVTSLQIDKWFGDDSLTDNGSNIVKPNNIILPFNSSVTKLKFGDWFRSSIIENSIPNSVTSLSLGRNFNKDLLKGYLSDSILELEILSNYKNELWLPKNLKKLVFGICQSNEVVFSNYNFHSLEYLDLGHFFFNLKQLLENGTLRKLENLQTLRLPYTLDVELNENDLPESLTELEFKCIVYKYPISQGVIPSRVKILKLSFYNNDMAIPPNVEILEFKEFNKNLINSTLPESLTELKFGSSFASCLPSELPYNLLKLSFKNSRYDQRLYRNDAISKLTKLKYLEFSDFLSFEIPNNYLPDSLEVIKFGSDYSDFKLPSKLPTNLKTLYISKNLNISNIEINSNNLKIIKI